MRAAPRVTSATRVPAAGAVGYLPGLQRQRPAVVAKSWAQVLSPPGETGGAAVTRPASGGSLLARADAESPKPARFWAILRLLATYPQRRIANEWGGSSVVWSPIAGASQASTSSPVTGTRTAATPRLHAIASPPRRIVIQRWPSS